MTNPWQWIVPGSIGAVIGSIITELFRWFYPNRKEWRAERQAKAEKSNDTKIISAMSNGWSWTAEQLAATCHIKLDVVDESIDRLEAKGRIKKIPATLSPVTSWFLVPR